MKHLARFFHIILFLSLVIGFSGCAPAAAPTPQAETEAAETEAVAPVVAEEEAAPAATEEPAIVAETEEPAAEVEPITLRYQSFTAESMPAEMELIKEYETNHPNIKIQLEPCPAMECYDKVVIAHQANNASDVFMGWWTFDVATAGVALNLDPYIEKAGGDEFIAKYIPSAFEMGEKDGSVYSLPWRTGCSVAYFNQGILEKSGLELPPDDWTWEDFRSYAKAMTNPEEGYYGLALSGASTDTGVEWIFFTFLLQAGGDILKDNRAAFNSEAGVKALQFLSDLIYVDKVVHPGIAEADVNMVLDLFAANKVGMWIEGPWYIEDLKVKYPDAQATLGLAPRDVTDGSGAGGTSLMVSTDSKHPQEAFDFISWMTSKEQLARWSEGAVFIPAAVGANTSEAFQKPHMQVAVKALMQPNTRTFNLYPENSYLNSIIRGYLVSVYLGEMEPKEALDQAAAEWDEVLKKYYP